MSSIRQQLDALIAEQETQVRKEAAQAIIVTFKAAITTTLNEIAKSGSPEQKHQRTSILTELKLVADAKSADEFVVKADKLADQSAFSRTLKTAKEQLTQFQNNWEKLPDTTSHIRAAIESVFVKECDKALKQKMESVNHDAEIKKLTDEKATLEGERSAIEDKMAKTTDDDIFENLQDELDFNKNFIEGTVDEIKKITEAKKIVSEYATLSPTQSKEILNFSEQHLTQAEQQKILEKVKSEAAKLSAPQPKVSQSRHGFMHTEPKPEAQVTAQVEIKKHLGKGS